MLVCVRLFGQMLQHGHEAVKTLAHLGVLLLKHMPLAFRLHTALTPLFREGEVVRLGETAPRRVDVRIVAATNRAVPQLLESQQLRADLYHRIAAIELSMPALRTRPEDVRPLVQRFTERFCYEINRRIPSIGEDTPTWWPTSG